MIFLWFFPYNNPFFFFNPLSKQRNLSPKKKKKRIFLILYLPTSIYNNLSVFKILKNLYFQRHIFPIILFLLLLFLFFVETNFRLFIFLFFFFFTHDRAKSVRDDNARATTPGGGNFIIQPSRPKLFRGPWINYVARNHVGARATLRKHLLSA